MQLSYIQVISNLYDTKEELFTQNPNYQKFKAAYTELSALVQKEVQKLEETQDFIPIFMRLSELLKEISNFVKIPIVAQCYSICKDQLKQNGISEKPNVKNSIYHEKAPFIEANDFQEQVSPKKPAELKNSFAQKSVVSPINNSQLKIIDISPKQSSGSGVIQAENQLLRGENSQLKKQLQIQETQYQMIIQQLKAQNEQLVSRLNKYQQTDFNYDDFKQQAASWQAQSIQNGQMLEKISQRLQNLQCSVAESEAQSQQQGGAHQGKIIVPLAVTLLVLLGLNIGLMLRK